MRHISERSEQRLDDLETEHLRFVRNDPIAWCIVDRPASRNALTRSMYRGLARAVHRVTADAELDALIITGTDDVFISGGDLRDETETDEPLSASLPFSALRNSRVPVVAAVNGLCQGSGVLLALLSDLAVASERATFRTPELFRGFPDTWLAAVLPAHVGVGRARDLALTGRTLDAHEAVAIGLVERVVTHDLLVHEAERVARSILETAPAARNLWRRAVNARYGVVDEIAFDEAVTSPEVLEGFRAFRERRPPSWTRGSAPMEPRGAVDGSSSTLHSHGRHL